MITSGLPRRQGRRVAVGYGQLFATMVCVMLAFGLCEKVHASDRQVVADVRCVVVGLHLIQMTTPRQRAAGMMLAMYFLGRLDEGAPHADIEELIEREVGKMNSAEFRSNAARCGKALALKGQELQKVGAELVHKGQGGMPPK